jgi:hypothetical protein
VLLNIIKGYFIHFPIESGNLILMRSDFILN